MTGGLETVVRSVVFPEIRPAPAQPAKPPDNAGNGQAFLGGASTQVVKLTLSEQSSWSRQHRVEAKRRYQKVRVPYTRPDGTLDFSRYTEIEVLQEVDFFEDQEVRKDRYADLEVSNNYEIVASNLTRTNPGAPK